MYPFGSLPSNLIGFGDFLRREYKFQIGSGELHDTARALELVDLANEIRVRDALRPILSRTLEDAAVFDHAFTTFFFPPPKGVTQEGLGPLRLGVGPETALHEKRVEAGPQAAPDEAEEEEGAKVAGETFTPLAESEPGAAPALLARTSYSPLEAESARGAPVLRRAEPAWRDAARVLVRRLHLGLSRRWRSAARGPRFDLRRTLRASLQTGGEAITARWLRRPRRAPRFVLLIDGSRSMGPYTQTALEVAAAMASATMRLEVFTFSTALQRVTNDVRRSAAGEARRLEHLRHAWAGGTSIGPCLREFLRRFGERTMGRATVVMIVSDGLDVGEPGVLRDAMRELHQRSAGLVWLNPLLETAGYEPTASGMRAARPYITTFASANDVEGFARLSRLVRVRT
ncbi:MAG TPA: VWA domain-containing protein [Patescibacteria group bacterium]|nr:VWA domain-containing protein [Patescibacteria group bacterium]